MTVWVQNVRHVEESGRTVSTAPSWHTPRRTEMLLYRRHCEYVLERACVCLCACVWKERKGTSQGVNRNASALIEGCHADPLGACLSLTHTYTHTHTLSLSQLVSVFCCLGYTGGLAERRADGWEVERPTERPGAILQRPGLTVGPGHSAYQTAQQVRGVFLLY